MEVKASQSLWFYAQRIIVGVLLACIALLAFLVIREAFKGTSATPRTSLEQAYLDALTVVKKNPNNAKARFKLGMAYAAASRYNDALTELNTAVKLDPKDPEIYYGLGYVARRTDDTSKAIEALQRAVKLEGAEAGLYREAYYELGDIYYQQKNYKAAVSAFEKSASMGPETTYVLIALANAYEKTGDKAKAIDTYKLILAYAPDYKQAKDALKRLGGKP